MRADRHLPSGPAQAPVSQVVSVLLLEDDQQDAYYIRETLEPPTGVQFDITHVRLLSDALDFVACNEVDVALVDLNLPDSAGNNTVNELRHAGFRAPIVVLTSQQMDSLPSLVDTNGAAELIQKWDLDGSAVSRTLLYVVERHRREEQLRRITRDHVDATFVVGTDRKDPVCQRRCTGDAGGHRGRLRVLTVSVSSRHFPRNDVSDGRAEWRAHLRSALVEH